MILQKLALAIRRQDWFTVVLEILIVIVGIFMGLQVDDWNQQRKDRALEQEYLERLLADMNGSIEDFLKYSVWDRGRLHAQQPARSGDDAWHQRGGVAASGCMRLSGACFDVKRHLIIAANVYGANQSTK